MATTYATMDDRIHAARGPAMILHLPLDCWHRIVNKLHGDDLNALWMTGSRSLQAILNDGGGVRSVSITVNTPLAEHAFFYRWPIFVRRYGRLEKLSMDQHGAHATRRVYWVPSPVIPLSQYMPRTLTHLYLDRMTAPLETILINPTRCQESEPLYQSILAQSQAFLATPRTDGSYAQLASNMVQAFFDFVRAYSPWVAALPQLTHFQYSTLEYEQTIIDLSIVALLPPTLHVLELPTLKITTCDNDGIPSFATLFPHVHYSRHLALVVMEPVKQVLQLVHMWMFRTFQSDAYCDAVRMHPQPQLHALYGTKCGASTLRIGLSEYQKALPRLDYLTVQHMRDIYNGNDGKITKIMDTLMLPEQIRHDGDNNDDDGDDAKHADDHVMSKLLQFVKTWTGPVIDPLCKFFARIMTRANLSFLLTMSEDDLELHGYRDFVLLVVDTIQKTLRVSLFADHDEESEMEMQSAVAKLHTLLDDAAILSDLVAKIRSEFYALTHTYRQTQLHCAICNLPLDAQRATHDNNVHVPSTRQSTLHSHSDINAIPNEPLQRGALDEIPFYGSEWMQGDLTRTVAHLNEQFSDILQAQNAPHASDVWVYRSMRVRRVLYLAMQVMHVDGMSMIPIADVIPTKMESFHRTLQSYILQCTNAYKNFASDKICSGRIHDMDMNQLFAPNASAMFTLYPLWEDDEKSAHLREFAIMDFLIIAWRYLTACALPNDASHESSQCHVNCGTRYDSNVYAVPFDNRWRDIRLAFLYATCRIEDDAREQMIVPISRDDFKLIRMHELFFYCQYDDISKNIARRRTIHGIRTQKCVSLPPSTFQRVIICMTHPVAYNAHEFPVTLTHLQVAISFDTTKNMVQWPLETFQTIVQHLPHLARISIMSLPSNTSAMRMTGTHVFDLVSYLPSSVTFLELRVDVNMGDIPIVWPPNLHTLIVHNNNDWKLCLMSSPVREPKQLMREQIQALPATLTHLDTNCIYIPDMDALPTSITCLRLDDPIVIRDLEHLRHLPSYLQTLIIAIDDGLPYWDVDWPTSLTKLCIRSECTMLEARRTHMWFDFGGTLKNTTPPPFFPPQLRHFELSGRISDGEFVILDTDLVQLLPTTLTRLKIKCDNVYVSTRACRMIGTKLTLLDVLDIRVTLICPLDAHEDGEIGVDDDDDDDDGCTDDSPSRRYSNMILDASRYYYLESKHFRHDNMELYADDARRDVYKRASVATRVRMSSIIASLPHTLRSLAITMDQYGDAHHELMLPWMPEHYAALPCRLRHFRSDNPTHYSVSEETVRHCLPYLQARDHPDNLM